MTNPEIADTTVDVTSELIIANARYNSLIAALTDPDRYYEFAEFSLMAREELYHVDHDFSHVRRVERYVQTLALLHNGDIGRSIKPWLSFLYLYAGLHDKAQLLELERNRRALNGGDGVERSVKNGHASTGAAQICLWKDLYIAEGKFAEGENPEQIVFGACLMTLFHDDLPRAMKSVHGTQKAYTVVNGEKIPLSDDDLIRYFKNGDLDKFSLSVQDVIRIARIEKGANQFLHPYVEQLFNNELAIASNDTRRLFDTFSSEERVTFERAMQVGLLADVLDYLIPPIESIMRTLSTQYSKQREFFHCGSFEEILEAIKNGSGRPGENCDCDVVRIMWELVNSKIAIQDEMLNQDPFINQLLGEAALSRLEAFEKIGSQLLNNDYDFTLDDLYFDRLLIASQKALFKSGYTRDEVRAFGENFANLSIEEITTRTIDVVMNHNQHVGKRLAALLRSLKDEVASFKEQLRKKPGYRIYDAEDRERFNKLAAVVRQVVSERFNIDSVDQDPEAYRVKRGVVWDIPWRVMTLYPSDTPYKSYDSVGGQPDKRRKVVVRS